MSEETVFHTHRRVSDEEITTLIGKVSTLELNLNDLRREFDNQIIINDKSHKSLGIHFQQLQEKVDKVFQELRTHTAIEEQRVIKYNQEIGEIKKSLQSLETAMGDHRGLVEQVFGAIDGLRKEVIEIKLTTAEPVQAYTTAKSVFIFGKWLVELGKILVLLGIGATGSVWILHQLNLY